VEDDHKNHKEEHKSHKYSSDLNIFFLSCFVTFVFFFVIFVVKAEGGCHEDQAMDAAVGEMARSRAG
jgi:glycerol uptake facilitator-like aquaporin